MFFQEASATAELLGVFQIKRDALFHESTDRRAYDSIALRLEGEGHFQTTDTVLDVTSDDLLYIPQNVHYTQTTKGETIIAIHFLNYSISSRKTMECLRMEDSEELRAIACRMYKIWNEKKPGYKYLCTSLFYQLLYAANKQFQENALISDDLSKRMKTAIDFIHKNYRHMPISVADLAKKMSVSETYFRRLFKKLYVLSPSQYIINLRLEYASQLLLSKFYKVSEVAEKSGFQDEKYFSRIFKQKYGMPPRSYAEQLPFI